MFKKILWATDFSAHARDAGQRALQCAQCSEGVLYALTVVDPEDLPVILEDIPDPFIKTEQMDQLNRHSKTNMNNGFWNISSVRWKHWEIPRYLWRGCCGLAPPGKKSFAPRMIWA